ncbi:unnamed protein product [Aureobasidium mustum]|uniref:Uncharacterized protein n=1 Tax=Aureobasidium mustum TaxID=2773714 RepID=A0A9N8JN68_9PEZI|nr:unnamed protein product [Aureobasidium mustum]
MSFCSGFRALFSCFGSNNNSNSNKGLASPPQDREFSFSRVGFYKLLTHVHQSGPRCFTHHKTGNPNIPLRAFVSTPPPYVQPERP